MDNKLFERVRDETWLVSIHECVQHYGKKEFALKDFISNYIDILSRRFPDNNHIEAGVRREMQHLRDKEVIEFIDNKGNYRCLYFLERKEWEDMDFQNFSLKEAPKPNMPIHELHDSVGQFEFKTPFSAERKLLLGNAGEKAVISNEKRKLHIAGFPRLAEKVEQVSVTRGDDEGYDVLSFDSNGKEKWIEVKTTTGRQATQFHISENQLRTADQNPSKYWLYRLYEFQTRTSCSLYFTLNGKLRSQLHLEATNYKASAR
ncbi:MAG: DUF3883 domain-containing protein [Planctomycetota bacterium]